LDHVLRIILDPGHLARSVFKIMHVPAVALFNDFLPSAEEQLPKIMTDGWVAHWIFYRATPGWHPSWGTEPEAYTSGYRYSGIATPAVSGLSPWP
jgi:hypothetical protein